RPLPPTSADDDEPTLMNPPATVRVSRAQQALEIELDDSSPKPPLRAAPPRATSPPEEPATAATAMPAPPPAPAAVSKDTMRSLRSPQVAAVRGGGPATQVDDAEATSKELPADTKETFISGDGEHLGALEELLGRARSAGASDLLMVSGRPVMMRV